MNYIILAYHRVLPLKEAINQGALSVTIENFRWQLQHFIRKGWISLTLSEFYEKYVAVGKVPYNVFVVTFDDGYEDNYFYAFPVLKEFDVKATIFLTYDFLFNHKQRTTQFSKIHKALSIQEIREMHDEKIEFGSHTVTHPHLTSVPQAKAQEEVYQSRLLLEEILQLPIESFCYPYGDTNEEVISYVREAGYKVGVVTPPRVGVPVSQYTLRRIGVYLTTSKIKFLFKCTSLYYRIREHAIKNNAETFWAKK